MEGRDPEVANWSEKLEDLVESGAIDNAISFLETLILKLQHLSSTVAELQLTSALFELAKLYDTKGFSIRADETRSRALAIKNCSLHPLLPHQAYMDREIARESSEQVRVSIEGELPENSRSTKDVLVNDGYTDTNAKSSIGDGQPGEAFSDDDWEAKADAAPDELLPTQQLPEVSKISLEDSVEVPKRRGRGTFSYKKEVLYSDQVTEESVYDSEQKVDDTAKQDSTVKKSAYGTRHVVVLDGFPPSYNTMDLENIFKNYKDKFVIRWVNDTVALAVFRSPSVALEASKSVNCQFSVRLLEEDDILIGSIPSRELEPPKQRPQTSARTAQRLIAQGMGIKIPLNSGSKELRRQEEARKNRIISRQNLKDDAWGPDN